MNQIMKLKYNYFPHMLFFILHNLLTITTLNLCSSLSVKDQHSLPYRIGENYSLVYFNL
jgi:hypothetical protein